jgi:hypothetical protein
VGALSRANRAALAAVRAAAERDRPRDLARIAAVLAAAGADADPAMLVAATAAAAPLTINFHPDRLLADGRPVARALLDEGVYRTQFEARISNGGLTAYPGGDRDRWEQALFAGAYQAAGVAPAERPRYGGLNLMRWRNGACPRLGSCHLQLRPAAKARATLLFGDSAAHPTEISLADAFAPVLAPLLEHLASGDGALGRGGFGIAEFVAGVLDGDAAAGSGLFAPAMTNTLDDYVEAHVHGAVRLGTDVEALVADPSFAGTPTGDLLTAAAERHGFAPAWNDGLVLPLARVPREARRMPSGAGRRSAPAAAPVGWPTAWSRRTARTTGSARRRSARPPSTPSGHPTAGGNGARRPRSRPTSRTSGSCSSPSARRRSDERRRGRGREIRRGRGSARRGPRRRR